MTTYSLMDGVSGRPGTGSSGTQPPSAGTSYSGNYIAGLVFGASQGGIWFEGYRWWVPSTVSQTGAQKFALWQISGNDAAVLVPGSVVTSGTLTAGAWNYVALSTPLALMMEFAYIAATGYVSSSGFPKSGAQFGTGDPYVGGITNGPLFAYAFETAAAEFWPQMPYSVAGSDPSVTFPATDDDQDILWIDVQVSDTAPSGATYRAFPNAPAPISNIQDVSYTLGMEFSLSQPCTLEKIWHYSAPGSSVLPSRCGIWVAGTQTELAGSDNSSPAWLDPDASPASAGDGWIYCDYSASGVTLAASTNYKVSTFANAGASDWFAATTAFWGASDLWQDGIVSGPLTVPGNASASPGQNSWNQGTSWTYPDTSSAPENDWVDVEVTPVSAPPPSGLLMASFP